LNNRSSSLPEVVSKAVAVVADVPAICAQVMPVVAYIALIAANVSALGPRRAVVAVTQLSM
jgi:hypothetical protein